MERKMVECERTYIERWSNFKLSPQWKKVGIGICLTLVIASLSLKFAEIGTDWLRGVFRRGILIGLLMVSLSKEKIEDEMVVSLRSKSYALAFIFGVGFSLFQPISEYLLHNFVYPASKDNGFSYFEMLSFMLMMQIVFFEVLKRNR